MMNFQRLNQLYQVRKVNLDILNAKMADINSLAEIKVINSAVDSVIGEQIKEGPLTGSEEKTLPNIPEEGWASSQLF